MYAFRINYVRAKPTGLFAVHAFRASKVSSRAAIIIALVALNTFSMAAIAKDTPNDAPYNCYCDEKDAASTPEKTLQSLTAPSQSNSPARSAAATPPAASHTHLDKLPKTVKPTDLTTQNTPSTARSQAAPPKAHALASATQANSAHSVGATSDSQQSNQPLTDQERRNLMCPKTAYQTKAVAINLFPRRDPHSAKLGALHHIEEGLAKMFRQQLIDQRTWIPEQYLGAISDKEVDEARRELAQKTARTQQTQFVLQGYIDDMSMPNSDANYHPSVWNRTTNLITDRSANTALDRRQRYFGMTLELRDGFTGETVFTKSYDTWGFWKLRQPVGFTSAQFQRSDYGNKIRKLVETASRDLADTLACQPFMASLDIHPGRRDMVLAGGANNGLRAGDRLALYQLVATPSNTEYMVTQTRLIKRPQHIQLSEVYPSHATAVANDGRPLSGHYLAVYE